MGVNSSQIASDPQKSTAPPAEPRYSPGMDDFAASQQLLEEDERAIASREKDEAAPSPVPEGIWSPPTWQRSKNSMRNAKKSRQTRLGSPWAPATRSTPRKKAPESSIKSFALEDLQNYADDIPGATQSDVSSPPQPQSPPRRNLLLSPHEVEVPDSQIALPTAVETGNALMSPPTTSSLTIPASMPEKNQVGKAKQKRSAKSIFSNASRAHESTTSPRRANAKNKKSLPPSTPMSTFGRDGSQDVATASVAALSEDRQDSNTRQPEDVEIRTEQTPVVDSSARAPTQAEGVPDNDSVEDGESANGEPSSGESDTQKPEASSSTSVDEAAAERHQEPLYPSTPMVANGKLPQARTSTRRKSSATAPAKMSASSRRGGSKADVRDWKAPVRSLGDSPNKDTIALPDGTDDEFVNAANGASPDNSTILKSTRKGRASQGRRASKNLTKTPQSENGRRWSRIIDTSYTTAEKALNTVRDLNIPPNLRSSGDFTNDEEELLRRALRDYQERKGLDTNELVELIQRTRDSFDRTSSVIKPEPTQEELDDEQESRDFWQELKQTNSERTMQQIRNHVRTRYHIFKTGGWTDEEDQQLLELYEQHPRHWRIISTLMGDRSLIDCHNRWRDYLQYGEHLNTGRWSIEEDELLLTALNTVVQKDEEQRAQNKQPPLVYTSKCINWYQVCTEMGHTRTRLQCLVRWKKLKAHDSTFTIRPNYIDGREPDVNHPVNKPTPSRQTQPKSTAAAIKSTNSSKTPQKKRRRSTGTQDENKSIVTPAKKRRRSRKSQIAGADAVVGQQALDEPQKEIPHTPAQNSTVPAPTSSTPQLSQMRWGDKFDLVEAIAASDWQNVDEIDWHQLATGLKKPWSVQTLQAALREVLDLVDDQGSLPETAYALMNHLGHALDPSALKEYHDPVVEAAADDIATEEVTAEAEPASQPKTRKRRILGAWDKTPGSPATSLRGKRGGTASRPRRSVKSAMFISADDDADSDR